MTPEDELLLEEALSAYRARGPEGEVRPSPAWYDLPESLREEAHREAERLRQLEAALDPKGLSSTARAVLARIRGQR